MKKWSLTGCLLKHFDFEIKMDYLKGKPCVYTLVYELRLSFRLISSLHELSLRVYLVTTSGT